MNVALEPTTRHDAGGHRRAIRWRWPDRIEWAVIVIAIVAAVLRLYELDVRALHHDESLHATFSWYFAEGRGYRHDPLMHGPLQFHLIAGTFVAFGDNDFTARLPHALAGTLLVASPLLLRRWLGTAGVITAAVLLMLSPTLLYYSRFARNDILVACWTVLLLTAVWRYLEEARFRWLVLLAAALSLSFATKETAYLAVAVLLLYLDGLLAVTLATEAGWRDGRRLFGTLALLPVAWLLAAFWPLTGRFRERLGFAPVFPRAGVLLLVTGTLVLPVLAAAIEWPIMRGGGELNGDRERTVGIVTAGSLLIASLLVGTGWSWRRWLILAGVFYGIAIPLYAALFTNPEGVAGLFWTSLDYWIEQQDVQRGGQPGYYYLLLVPLYEFLPLLLAIAAGGWLLRRGDRLAALLTCWTLGNWLLLSMAGEKMPWLTVHIALPLILLAAYGAGSLLPRLATHLRRPEAGMTSWALTGGGAAFVVVLSLLTVRTAVDVTYRHPDTPVEPLIYTQTAPDVPRVLAELEHYAAARGLNPASLPIVVDDNASLSWPWAWYLRDWRGTTYGNLRTLDPASFPADAVLIMERGSYIQRPELHDTGGVEREFVHRWWFPEEGYRALTVPGIWEEFRDGTLLDRVASFIEHRIPPDTLGAVRGVVVYPAEGTAAP